MKNIALHELHIDGFRSYRTPTTVKFTQDEGFKFIRGAMGAGKSSLFGSFFWCAYGTDLLDLRISDAQTWGRLAPTSVSADITVNDVPTTISRTGPPSVVCIDGQVVTQDKIDDLLGRNAAQMRHSVIFGQENEMFVNLSPPERAVILDRTMNLGYWLRISKFAGDESKRLQKEADKLELVSSRLRGQALVLCDTEDVRKRAAEWKERYNVEVESALVLVSTTETDMRRAKQQLLAHTRVPGPNLSEIELKIQQLTLEQREYNVAAVQVERELTGCLSMIQFYDHNTNCPTCKQNISKEFVQNELQLLHQTAETLRAQAVSYHMKLNQTTNLLYKTNGELNDRRKQKEEMGRIYAVLNEKFNNYTDNFNRAEKAAEQLLHAGTANPFEQRLVEMEHQLKVVNAELQSLANKFNALLSEIRLCDFWQGAFKRLRLFYIKRITAILEAEINAVVSVLGLGEWHVAILVETENKSGTIKHGVQIETSYQQRTAVWKAWSGGEKQRLKMAISIGLANLIERSTGVRYTFEIWDEPMTWTENSGIEKLMEMLRHRAMTTHKSIYITSHSINEFGRFTEIIDAVKENGATNLTEGLA